jgi:glutaryl-CoA dehydrogenase (non-decarboxylating)
MDFAFSEEQAMIARMARDFAKKEIAPHFEEDEENHYYRREILTRWASGLLGSAFPRNTAETAWADGGVAALYEIAKVHTSWRLSISGNVWGPLSAYCSSAPRSRSRVYSRFMQRRICRQLRHHRSQLRAPTYQHEDDREGLRDHWLLNGC